MNFPCQRNRRERLGYLQAPAHTGLITLDPGYAHSELHERHHLHGRPGGILRYGVSIEQLVEHSSFVETSYLLMNGELPRESKSMRSQPLERPLPVRETCSLF